MPYFEFNDGSFISTGGNKPTSVLSKSVQFSDNLTWTTGRHTFKTGVDVQRVEYRDQSSFFAGDDFGSYSFTGQFSGNAFADFLLGLPSYDALRPEPAGCATLHDAVCRLRAGRLAPQRHADLQLRPALRPAAAHLDRSNQLANFDRDFPGGRIIVANEARPRR